MGARQKLNAAALLGNALTAGLFGMWTNSGTVFDFTLIILTGCCLHTGDVRLNQRPRRGAL